MNEPRNQGGHVPWWAGVAAFVLVVSGLYFFMLAASAIDMLRGAPALGRALSTPAGVAAQVFVTSGTLAVIAILVPRRLGVSPLRWLRLNRASRRILLAGSLGVVGIGFLVDEVTFLLHLADPGTFDTGGLDYFNRLFSEGTWQVFALLTFTVTVGPGLGEELFFRGLVLRSLGLKLPPWPAILATAVLFGLIHMDSLQGPGAGLIGVYLGFLAIRTGSLWPAVAGHALNNFLCAVFARIAPPGPNPLFDTGHPWWLLLLAGTITGLAVLAVVRLTRGGRVNIEGEGQGTSGTLGTLGTRDQRDLRDDGAG